MSPKTILQILTLFGTLSLLSIGGGNTVLPDMQMQSQNNGWLTPKQFADLFAISQAAPGPSVLIVTLVGYKAGGTDFWGVIGAIIATVAMVLPAGFLVYFTAKFWNSAKEAKWRKAVERGFAPLTVALVLASGVIVAKSADHSYAEWIITAIATVIFTCTKTNPLIVVGVAGCFGWLAGTMGWWS